MIKIVNLTKSFDGHKVLDGINLTMPTGQITVVIGKSGVGKSVLLKHIIGLLKPDSGQILVDGQDMSLLAGPPAAGIQAAFRRAVSGRGPVRLPECV